MGSPRPSPSEDRSMEQFQAAPAPRLCQQFKKKVNCTHSYLSSQFNMETKASTEQGVHYHQLLTGNKQRRGKRSSIPMKTKRCDPASSPPLTANITLLYNRACHWADAQPPRTTALRFCFSLFKWCLAHYQAGLKSCAQTSFHLGPQLAEITGTPLLVGCFPAH